MKRHISYSEIKDWKFCPYYRYLLYDVKLPKEDSIFLRFGTVIHSTCEKIAKKELISEEDCLNYYFDTFDKGMLGLTTSSEQDIALFREQGQKIVIAVRTQLPKSFGDNYQLVSAEYELMEPIKDFVQDPEIMFKGYIDLILYTPDDDRYHIIDWKTASWGWDARKKGDSITSYQLVLYKYYYATKHNIPLDKIDLHFILLKRTEKNESKRIEKVDIACKERKLANAKAFMFEALHNIRSGKHIKYRTRCNKCKFNNTEHCKK